MALGKSSKTCFTPNDMLTGLTNLQSPQPPKEIPQVPSEPKKPHPVAEKKKPGRPRKFQKNEKTVVLGIKVKEEEARFLEEYGGKYGGKTGYVTYLIQQEMKKHK